MYHYWFLKQNKKKENVKRFDYFGSCRELGLDVENLIPKLSNIIKNMLNLFLVTYMKKV